MSESMKDAISNQVKSLLQIYPGRYKWSWLWLLVIPIAWMMITFFIFKHTLRTTIEYYSIFLCAGEIAFLYFALTMFLASFRVVYSSPNNWRETLIIAVSSVVYTTILFLTATIVVWCWGISIYNISFVSMMQVMLSILLLCAICSGTAIVTGWVAYRIPMVVPLVILITILIGYITPVNYSAGMIPSKYYWIVWVSPLFGVTDIFRNSLINSNPTLQLSWLAGSLYGALGCLIILFSIWGGRAGLPR